MECWIVSARNWKSLRRKFGRIPPDLLSPQYCPPVLNHAAHLPYGLTLTKSNLQAIVLAPNPQKGLFTLGRLGKEISCRSVEEMVFTSCSVPWLAATYTKVPSSVKDALTGMALFASGMLPLSDP